MAGRLRLRPALRRYAHSVQRRATPGFAGPYDAIPDIVAAYGMRRLLSAYEGPILRLRRDSDQAEQDFGYTDNGDLDVAAIAAWLSGANGLITTWYDQSGNANHAVQTTAAAQPLYVASGQNSRPVARFDGSDDYLDTGVIPSNGWSLIVRYSDVATFSFSAGFVGSLGASANTSRFHLGYASPTSLRFGYGGEIVDYSESTLSGVAALAPPDVYYDAADVGNTGTISSAVASIYIGARNSNGVPSYSTCNIYELIISNASYDAAQVATITGIMKMV